MLNYKFTFLLILLILASELAPAAGEIISGEGVKLKNFQEPFDYFSNSWGLIGLKDYPDGTRITPNGDLILGEGNILRFFISDKLLPLNRQAKKTLLKGFLPIIKLDFIINNTIRYTIIMFASPLPSKDSDWQAQYTWPKETENYLNFIKIKVRNITKAPKKAYFGFQVTKEGQGVPLELVQLGGVRRFVKLQSDGKTICVLSASQKVEIKKEERISFVFNLKPKEEQALVLRMPFRPLDNDEVIISNLKEGKDFDEWLARTTQFWEHFVNKGAKIELPEDKVTNTYRASLIYEFIGRDRGDIHPGEGFYDGLFLRDGAYQIYALELSGFLEEAKESLEFFLKYQRSDGQFCSQEGQLDGNGQALWALVQYYQLSKDIEWLKKVYHQIKKSAQWIKQTRRKETNPKSPFYGILPCAPADGENLWDSNHHIVGYDFWNLRGLQCALKAAKALGENKDAQEFAQEFSDYHHCIFKAIEKTGLPYLPPSYEKAGTHWGNLEVIFPTQLLKPKDKRVTETLKEARTKFGGGFVEGTIRWSPQTTKAIHPYMSQFITNSHIIRGEYTEALEGFYSYLLHTTATHGFAEGVHYQTREGWGDVIPHLWAAAMYIIDLRNMLIREQDKDLHILSCLPSHWLGKNKEIKVTNAPTEFGLVSFTIKLIDERIRIKLEPPKIDPPEEIIIHLPQGFETTKVLKDGKIWKKFNRNSIIVPPEAKEIIIYVCRHKIKETLNFDRLVAKYEKERKIVYQPIQGLEKLPLKEKVKAKNCQFINLSKFANTNPFTAPFNVPNPGKYIFEGLPLGIQNIGGIPFKIIDPQQNSGKGLVVLEGADACQTFPRQIEIPVNLRGTRLFILGNVGGWAPTDPGVGKLGAVAEYIICYADGHQHKIPLIAGRTIDDWAMPPNATEAYVGLQKGIWHLNILALKLKPKKITKIIFRDLGTPTSPVLAAITIEKK